MLTELSVMGEQPSWTRGADGVPMVDGDSIAKTGKMDEELFLFHRGLSGEAGEWLVGPDTDPDNAEAVSLERLQEGYVNLSMDCLSLIARDCLFDPVAYCSVHNLLVGDRKLAGLPDEEKMEVYERVKCIDIVERCIYLHKGLGAEAHGPVLQRTEDTPEMPIEKHKVYAVRDGKFSGCEAYFDGPVSEILGWSGLFDIYDDGRPVAWEFVQRMDEEGAPRAFLEDIPNLGYFHIGDFSHVLHYEQIDWRSGRDAR